jgi:hypothetical protein
MGHCATQFLVVESANREGIAGQSCTQMLREVVLSAYQVSGQISMHSLSLVVA